MGKFGKRGLELESLSEVGERKRERYAVNDGRVTKENMSKQRKKSQREESKRG